MERENLQEAPYGGPVTASLPFYDTHAGVRRLTQAGVEEPLAEAMVSEQLRVVGQNVASHADIAHLQNEIVRLQQDVRGEIGSVRGEVKILDGKVEALDGKVKALDGEVKVLRGEVKALDGKVEALDGEVKVLRGEMKALDGKVEALDRKTERFRQETQADIQRAQIMLLRWGVAQSTAIVLLVAALFQLQ